MKKATNVNERINELRVQAATIEYAVDLANELRSMLEYNEYYKFLNSKEDSAEMSEEDFKYGYYAEEKMKYIVRTKIAEDLENLYL